MTVRVVPFSELETAPNFKFMTTMYAAEAKLDGMPEPKPHMETYHALDKSGFLVTLCAFVEEEIVGFLTLTITMLPHYSVVVAHLESFFVLKDHRTSNAGLQLLSTAEGVAKKRGAVGIFLAAAVDGQLEKILTKMKRHYTRTHSGFFRRLA